MPVYSVIVCPKCRKSAQLIEQKGAKTTRCQRCGATLQTRKLRIFHTTDKLEEAIAVRTGLQAEILGKGYDTMKESGSSGVTSFSTFNSSASNASEITEKEIKLDFRTPDNSNSPGIRKKDPAKIILSILEKAGGEMQVTELHEQPLVQDIEEDIIERDLKKLLQKGDIYSPKKGYIKLVP